MRPIEMFNKLLQGCEFPWDLRSSRPLGYDLQVQGIGGIFHMRAGMGSHTEGIPEDKFKEASEYVDSKFVQHLQENWNG